MGYSYESRMIVIGQSPDGHELVCQFVSGAGPGISVKVGTHGGNNAFVVQQEPLPTIGTWGIVGFTDGDTRAGVWKHAIPASMVDAYTTGPKSSPYDRYHSYWAGGWYYQQGDTGEATWYYPDGTNIVVNAAGAAPAMYRHTVDSTQTRQRTAITQTQRRPAGPTAANWVKLNHVSGSTVSVDPSGNVAANVVSSAAWTAIVGSAEILANQNEVSITVGTSTVLTTSSTITLTAGGKTLSIGSGGITLDGILWETHFHPGVVAGGANTGPPA